MSFVTARCSPLSRAVDTARIILEGTATQLIVEPAFIEVSLGEFRRRLEADLRARMGEDYEALAGDGVHAWPRRRARASSTARLACATALFALREASGAGQRADRGAPGGEHGDEGRRSAAAPMSPAPPTFRQNNDEVDVWDMEQGARLEVFRIQWEQRG